MPGSTRKSLPVSLMTAMSMSTTEARLREVLARRILILDGAMGTMIQHYKLPEAGFRGDRFVDAALNIGRHDRGIRLRPRRRPPRFVGGCRERKFRN